MKPQSHAVGPSWTHQLPHPQQGWPRGSRWQSSLAWRRAGVKPPSFYKILNLQESTCRPKIKILWETGHLLTCTGGGPWGMGWSRDVKADMADMSTSSLTKMFPCTRVWISGDGGTVMYVEIWTARERETERTCLTFWKEADGMVEKIWVLESHRPRFHLHLCYCSLSHDPGKVTPPLSTCISSYQIRRISHTSLQCL